MNLSKRLKAVADLVPASRVIADIGCDHAHVAIYLIQNNIADKVIACDVNEGPLSAAKNNISLVGLMDSIELRLSDGLKELARNEADAVIIAGMGGPLMARIISEGLDRLRDGTVLILQPQSEISAFRHFLYDNKLDIQAESMIYEDGKFYPIMMAVLSDDDNRQRMYDNASDSDFAYGKLLIDSRNSVLYELLEREYGQLQKIRNSLNENGTSDRISEKIEEVDKKIALNRKTAGRYV